MLAILGKFRLVTFHTLATQKKLQHKTGLGEMRVLMTLIHNAPFWRQAMQSARHSGDAKFQCFCWLCESISLSHHVPFKLLKSKVPLIKLFLGLTRRSRLYGDFCLWPGPKSTGPRSCRTPSARSWSRNDCRNEKKRSFFYFSTCLSFLWNADWFSTCWASFSANLLRECFSFNLTKCQKAKIWRGNK